MIRRAISTARERGLNLTDDTAARLAGEGRREFVRRVHAEHQSIVDAIVNRDPEAARAAMRTHLSNSRERLRRAQDAQAPSVGSLVV